MYFITYFNLPICASVAPSLHPTPFAAPPDTLDPNGTPVMYDDFIYIHQDIMYGMIVCCNSDVYQKWESVIVNAKEKLVVI